MNPRKEGLGDSIAAFKTGRNCFRLGSQMMTARGWRKKQRFNFRVSPFDKPSLKPAAGLSLPPGINQTTRLLAAATCGGQQPVSPALSPLPEKFPQPMETFWCRATSIKNIPDK